MTQINVATRKGVRHQIDAKNGWSLMDCIRGAGLEELLALCGGNCSCATCHVYIAQDYLSRLPSMTVEEDELLESSEHRTKMSRLACQIKVGDDLAYIDIKIAPED